MLGMGTLNPCAKFQGLSQKRRGHWTLTEFGGLSLNRPVCVSYNYSQVLRYAVRYKSQTGRQKHHYNLDCS